MNKSLILAILTTTLIVIINAPVNSENVCEVKDPTGTALNVRNTPQGNIIGTLPNKHTVDIIDMKKDKKGNDWALVGGYYKGKSQEIGWVFKKYIDCKSEDGIFNEPYKVSDPTGTPLNVRLSPGGKLVTSLKNGTTVYIDDVTKDSKGKDWAKISLKQGDEFITLGWVYKNYLKTDLTGY